MLYIAVELQSNSNVRRDKEHYPHNTRHAALDTTHTSIGASVDKAIDTTIGANGPTSTRTAIRFQTLEVNLLHAGQVTVL